MQNNVLKHDKKAQTNKQTNKNKSKNNKKKRRGEGGREGGRKRERGRERERAWVSFRVGFRQVIACVAESTFATTTSVERRSLAAIKSREPQMYRPVFIYRPNHGSQAVNILSCFEHVSAYIALQLRYSCDVV